MSRQSPKARKALRSAAAKKGWETRRAKPYAFVLIHSCGKPAFGLTERPHYGTVGNSKTIRHLDGRPMEPSDPMVCESCGGSIGIPRSADVVPWPLRGCLDPNDVAAGLGSQIVTRTPLGTPAPFRPMSVPGEVDPNPWPRIAAAIRRGWQNICSYFR